MNAIVNLKAGHAERVPADLADRLVWLTKYGKPRVSFLSSGWYASIEMHVADTVKGTTFKVDSEIVAGPDEAVAQLIARMLDTLAKVGGA